MTMVIANCGDSNILFSSFYFVSDLFFKPSRLSFV